jgi:hypothetical protein
MEGRSFEQAVKATTKTTIAARAIEVFLFTTQNYPIGLPAIAEFRKCNYDIRKLKINLQPFNHLSCTCPISSSWLSCLLEYFSASVEKS